MTDINIDIGHLRQWIGRTEEATDVVASRLVDGLRATLDRGGDAVSAALHWCIAPIIVPESQLGPDGHAERGAFLPPVPLPRRIFAGGTLEFRGAFRLGDEVTRVSRIADVTAKTGRTGTLCFVTIDHEYRTPRGIAVVERQSVVYREADSPVRTDGGSEPPHPTPRWQRKLTADSVMLFRYSALTFNAHRIHFDRDYCRTVEGYPGLLVHGPLQATLLIEHAGEVRSAAPRQFTFRAVRPLFDGVEFSVNAVEEGGGLSLWVADGNGRATMTASAYW